MNEHDFIDFIRRNKNISECSKNLILRTADYYRTDWISLQGLLTDAADVIEGFNTRILALEKIIMMATKDNFKLPKKRGTRARRK